MLIYPLCETSSSLFLIKLEAGKAKEGQGHYRVPETCPGGVPV